MAVPGSDTHEDHEIDIERVNDSGSLIPTPGSLEPDRFQNSWRTMLSLRIFPVCLIPNALRGVEA
jgi:hypothetical protein